MERFWKHDFTRLILGNLATGLLILGVPVLILMQAVKVLDGHQANFVLVACVQFSLIALQISHNGSPVPRKWLAAFFLPLPVVNSALAIWQFQAGRIGWFFAWVGLATVSVFIVIQIVLQMTKKTRTAQAVVQPLAVARPAERWTHHDDDFPMPV